MTSRSRDLVVLESFGAPRPTTNPYVVMLLRALEATDGLVPLTFTWRRALLARYDVFHVHWPEILLMQGSGARRAARRLLFLLLLVRLRVLRVPVVRTQHNLRPHEDLGTVAEALLRGLDRQVAGVISLNRLPVPGSVPAHAILHGDYRDWYAALPQPSPETGRLGFFGLIRPYKGVEDLLDAFAATGPSLRLAIAGSPQDERLAARLRAAPAADPRVDVRLRHLSDAELVDHVCRSVLVVLPYRAGLNSGGALAALSLSRPVLMPATDANRLLADEVGTDWVRLYEGELTADVLEAEAARAARLSGAPDLSARRWSDAGPAHLAAFREAVDRR